MIPRMLALVIPTILVFGCEYQVPLSEEANIPIDAEILGRWEEIPEEGDSLKSIDRMVILKFSNTEYFIHYIDGDFDDSDNDVYFRAYHIQVGEIACVQTVVIGDESGPPQPQEKELYGVVLHSLDNGELEIRLLNPAVVDDNITDSVSLREAFLASQFNENLFHNPGKFRRVE